MTKLLRALGLTLLLALPLARPALADPPYQNMQPPVFTAIATATTTKLINHTSVPSDQTIYIYLSAWMSTGVNSANTIIPEYGQTVTNPCDTNTHQLWGAVIAAPTANGEWLNFWGEGYGNGSASVVGTNAPAPVALRLPNGYDWCVVTAGTTTLGGVLNYYGYGP